MVHGFLVVLLEHSIDPLRELLPDILTEELLQRSEAELIEAAGPRGHILNLGHGVDKDTPVESVEAFVDTAKAFPWD